MQGKYRISGVMPFITILTILIFCCYLINCCLQSSDCSDGSAEERQIWSSSKLGTKPTINRVQFKQLPNLGLYKVPQNRNNLLASPWILTEMSFNFYYFSSSEFLQFYLVSPSLVRTAATGADWGKVFQRKTFSDHLKHNYKKRSCLSFINASKYEVVYCLLFTLKIFFNENFCQLD